MLKGDDRAAEEAFREAIRITRSLPQGETTTLADTLALLGSTAIHRGEYDQAVQLLQESISLRRKLAPKQRLQIAIVVNSLANALIISGKDEALAAVIPEVLTSWREALPPNNLLLARVLTQTGIYRLDHEQYDEAGDLFLEAVNICRSNSNAPAAQYRQSLRGLATVLEHRGDLAGAIPLIVEEAQIARRSEAQERLGSVLQRLADLCWDVARDPRRTPEDYVIAREGLEDRLAADPDDLGSVATLGMLYYRLGRFDDALAALTRSADHNEAEGEIGRPADIAFIAMSHHRLGQTDEAREGLDRLRSVMRDPQLASAEDNVAFLAEAEALIAGDRADPRDPGG